MAETYEKPREGASIDTEYSKNKNAKVPGSGVYKHPESGQVAIVQGDPLWGNTQAQAFARLGFKFVREANEGEIKTLPELAADSRKAEEGNLKGLSARLDALETVAEDNKTLTNEVAELREKLAKAEEEKAAAVKEATKAAKAESKDAKATSDHIAKAGSDQVSTAQEQSAEHAKENAAKAQASREQASGDTNTNVTEKAGK